MPMEVAYTPKADGEAGTFVGRLEWNSKAGKLLRCDRAKNAEGNWVTSKVDISTIDQPDGSIIRPTMLFDFHSAQNCLMRMMPFDLIAVPINSRLPPMPPKYRDEQGNPVKDAYGKEIQHEQTVRVLVYSPKVFGEDAPIWDLSIKGINALATFAAFYNSVEATAEHAAGKLPLVRWDKPRTVDKNGNSVPVWTILGWHERPAAFPPRPAQAPSGVTAAPPPRPAAPAAPVPELAQRQQVAERELEEPLPF